VIYSDNVIFSDSDSVIDKVFSNVLFGFFLLTVLNDIVLKIRFKRQKAMFIYILEVYTQVILLIGYTSFKISNNNNKTIIKSYKGP
jgi:hypothetical protein